MNKKFLSAILFGALMVTSTGTFVSCKDYDDDIDAINKELTDIKSQIAALQSKVEAGVYVTNITEAKDGINVAFSNGSTSYVKTATVVEVETEACYESAASIVDGEWVITKADGTVVPTGVPASGVLVAGSQAAGYKLTVVNAAGEITEISLPTAASTLTSVKIVSGLTFGGPRTGATLTAGEVIRWGYCSGQSKWAGAKGAVGDGQLLVGDIASAQIDVTPSTVDLSSATFTLVNSLGEVAPVTIVATPNATKAADLITGSRAASTDGKWNLKLYLTNAVTKNNAASAFMKNGNHVFYALCVNGTPYTAYDIAIKMASGANALTYSVNDFAFKGSKNTAAVAGSSSKIDLNTALGTTTIDVNNDYVIYDSYLTLADKDQAERYGVTVDGMKITAPNTAAEKLVDVTIHILTVNGQWLKQSAKVTFGTITASEGTIEAQSFKLMPNNMNAVFSVGDLFSGLTAEEADKVANNYANGSVDWSADGYFYSDTNFDSAIGYYPNAACNSWEKINLTASTIRTIKYIKIDKAAINANTLASKITVKLSDASTNEIKKAKMNVTFTLPTFEELFSQSGAWDGSTISLKLNNNKEVNVLSAYGTIATGVVNSQLNVPVVYDGNGAAYFSYTASSNIMTVTAAAVNANTQNVNSFSIKPTYHLLAGKDYTKITAAEAVAVKLLSPIHGMTAGYVEAGAAATPVITGTSGLIAKYNGATATKAEDVKGLYLDVNGAKISAELQATLYKAGSLAGDVALSLNDQTNGTTTITFDAKAGKEAKATLTAQGLQLTGLASGNYDTVVTIKVVDKNGIKTVTTLTVKVKQ